MTIYNRLILALWIMLIVTWAVAALGAKRTIGGRGWWRAGALRLGLVVLAWLALSVPAARHALQHPLATGEVARAAGVVMCALGVGLAIWARVHLGRNWGMPMSRKENPDLVKAGPYSVVRHPIYAGILLALLGSAVGGSVVWLLPLILFAPYFIYSARNEEKLMLEQFPGQYPAYMTRTAMLLPFVL